MKNYMPQEIQVWYILPSLRKEFARCLCKEYGKTQKETAEMLGVTEAAISQYLKGKRATSVDFPPRVLEEVKQSCSKVISGKSTIHEEMYRISISEDVKQSMCEVHMNEDPTIKKECNICFKHENKW